MKYRLTKKAFEYIKREKEEKKRKVNMREVEPNVWIR